jgi:hypothetical protein
MLQHVAHSSANDPICTFLAPGIPASVVFCLPTADRRGIDISECKSLCRRLSGTRIRQLLRFNKWLVGEEMQYLWPEHLSLHGLYRPFRNEAPSHPPLCAERS